MNQHLWSYIVSTILLFLLFISTAQANSAASMPLLPNGTHLGFMVAYEALPDELAQRVDEHVEKAVERGMKVGRVMVDWADLEPEKGEYELDELRDALNHNAELGLKSFVTIGMLDSEGLVIPSYLLDPDDEARLKNGMDFDSPVFVRRFKKLLKRIVPIVVKNGGFALAVSNEPQFYLMDHGMDASALAKFVSEARKTVHGIAPNLAVTVSNYVLIGPRPIKEDPLVMPLVEVSDVAAFNYVPFETGDENVIEELRVGSVNRVVNDLLQISNASGGRQIIIQEFHAPSGYQGRSTSINMNPAKQKRLFKLALRSFKNLRKFRVVFLGSLVDWSPQLTQIFSDELEREGLSDSYVEQFTEWYETMGFVWYPSGDTKPAWTLFLQGLETLQR
jgi:hypothetical protein